MRHLLFVCLLLSGLGLDSLLLDSHGAKALDRYQVDSYALPNGLQVLLKPTDDKGHVAIRLIVGVGFDDFSCTRQELPHLLEHLFFSGLNGHGEAELEERMQTLGGEWNAFTSDADTAFVIEAPAANQRKALDLLLALMTQPPFDDAAIRSSKQAVTHEDGGHFSHLQRMLDHDTNEGDDANAKLAAELGLKCAGQASVDGLTSNELEQVRKDWYAPNNMTLIVVGDIDRQLPAYLEHTYGKLLPITPSEHPAPLVITHDAKLQRNFITHWLGEDAKLHWIFPEPEIGTQDSETWELLTDYLNWQLYIAMRLDNGLSYGPWAEQQSFGTQGFLSLNADVDRDQLDKAQTVMSKLIKRLRKEGLDPVAFQRMQNATVAKQAWAVQGNTALADFYWQAAGDADNGHIVETGKLLQAVTLAQANDALHRLLNQPGYVRVEKALLGDTNLYWFTSICLVVVAGLFFYWRRRLKQRPRAPSTMELH